LPNFILSLDQGTSSSRAILFDRGGAIVAVAQREFTQYFPKPGWVEHDPADIWSSQAATIDDVLARARVEPGDIAAVGIANQRETTLLWERSTGTPVARAIVWQDRRTADECLRLKAAGHEPAVAARTGLLLDPYFSATKLAWLLDHTAGARSRAERGELCFGTVDSWLAWNLSAGRLHVTDATNASRTLLYDLHSGDWAPDMLALFRIPRACLPTIVATSLHPPLAVQIAGREVPLGAMAGDQQAALFGQTCFQPGMAKNTYGTGCFMLMNTGGQAVTSRNRLLTTLAWDERGRRSFALEGSVFVGGAVVQWLRDGLGIIKTSADVEPLALSVDDTDGVYVVPAFSGLGSPHWDANARGTIVGLSRGSTAAHIARASLEAIAFQSTELLTAMQGDAAHALIELRVDGGATANDFLMQFQADLLGVPVVRPVVTETTALGAAYLAGLAVGFWESTTELARHWQIERTFEPRLGRDAAAERMRQWTRAVERSRGWREADAAI
jgi:glycerol kinase